MTSRSTHNLIKYSACVFKTNRFGVNGSYSVTPKDPMEVPYTWNKEEVIRGKLKELADISELALVGGFVLGSHNIKGALIGSGTYGNYLWSIFERIAKIFSDGKVTLDDGWAYFYNSSSGVTLRVPVKWMTLDEAITCDEVFHVLYYEKTLWVDKIGRDLLLYGTVNIQRGVSYGNDVIHAFDAGVTLIFSNVATQAFSHGNLLFSKSDGTWVITNLEVTDSDNEKRLEFGHPLKYVGKINTFWTTGPSKEDCMPTIPSRFAAKFAALDAPDFSSPPGPFRQPTLQTEFPVDAPPFPKKRPCVETDE